MNVAKLLTHLPPLSFRSILYQRGVYPSEQFTNVNKYGLSLYVTSEARLKEYLTHVLGQLRSWLNGEQVRKLVLVICSVEPKESLERWVFSIDQSPPGSAAPSPSALGQECAALMRQIFASVTFLPLLEGACTFDLLIYTDIETSVPGQWEESTPKYILHPSDVKLRSINAGAKTVGVDVQYKPRAGV